MDAFNTPSTCKGAFTSAKTCCCASYACGDVQGDSAAGNNVVCDFCQTAVQYIKIALDSNETMSQVSVFRRHGAKAFDQWGQWLVPVCLCLGRKQVHAAGMGTAGT